MRRLQLWWGSSEQGTASDSPGEAIGRMGFLTSPEKGSQMSIYGLSTQFGLLCEGHEHGGHQPEAGNSPSSHVRSL